MPKTYKFSNAEIVTLLKEVLAAMEVKQVNKFRIRAYQNVIASIEGLTVNVFNLWENKKLNEIPGMGTTLISHFDELFTTGKVHDFEDVKEGLPIGMFSLIGIRGIGAKKAFKLASAFELTSADPEKVFAKIKKAAQDNQISVLEGFGEKSQSLILEAISEVKKTKQEKQRILLAQAEELSARILAYLTAHPEIVTAEALGSFRRRQPTIGDLDIAIVTTNDDVAIRYFLKYSEIEEVLVHGDKRASVVMGNDFQVDIRVCTKKAFGAMVQYFTGSKAHNIVLRTFALERGCSLSEYGIKKNDKLHEFEKEEDFYTFLNLDYIPPEIRQGKNEVDLASKKKLPNLVTLSDIKGDVHSHTVFSDGVNTLEEMVNKARELGYEYIGISDHAPSVSARGYKEVEAIISSTKDKLAKINATHKDIKVLYGYEINILADAQISLPDELIKELDYAIASIHGAFTQDRETITKRLIAAAENPYINIIGHPSGRLINERAAYDVDWRAFLTAVKDNNKLIEINSQPNRLDLTEDLVFEAITRGIDLIINTDAHALDQLHFMRYGIDVARRGWCESKNIVNTKSVDLFLEALAHSSER